MTTKKSLVSISLVTFGNVLNTALGFIFFTAVARELPIEDFGKYALLTALLLGFGKLTDFGTNSVYVTKAISDKYTENAESVMVGAKLFLLIVSAALSALMLLIQGFAQPELVFFFYIGLVGYFFNYMLFALFQKAERFTLAVSLNTLPALIKGFLGMATIYGAVTLDLNLAFVIFSTSLLASLFLIPFINQKPTLKECSRASITEFLLVSFPAGISIVINSSWPAIAGTITRVFKSFTDVGIFSLAEKFANIFSLISLSIFTVILPKQAKQKNEQQQINYKEIVFLGLGVLTLGVLAVVGSNILFPVIFGDKYASSLPILNVLIIAAAITAVYTFVQSYFFVEEQTSSILVITLVQLGLFILFAPVLLAAFDLVGLAFAYLIVALGALGTTVLLIKRASLIQ